MELTRNIYRVARAVGEESLKIVVVRSMRDSGLDDTGAPWRDLPPDSGGWSHTHRRLIRWRDKGIWEKLLEIRIDEPDSE